MQLLLEALLLSGNKKKMLMQQTFSLVVTNLELVKQQTFLGKLNPFDP
jgi:hypothetical protein